MTRPEGGRTSVDWGAPCAALAVITIASMATHDPGLQLTVLTQRVVSWVVMPLVAVALLWRAVRRHADWASWMGFARARWTSLVWGVGLAVAILAATSAAYALAAVLHIPARTEQVAGIAALPLWARAVTVLVAGICEETIFRGYIASALSDAMRSRWLGLAGSALMFGLVHVPAFGWAHLLFVLPIGLILGLYVMMRRDLAGSIVAHLITDAIPLLVLPALS